MDRGCGVCVRGGGGGVRLFRGSGPLNKRLLGYAVTERYLCSVVSIARFRLANIFKSIYFEIFVKTGASRFLYCRFRCRGGGGGGEVAKPK